MKTQHTKGEWVLVYNKDNPAMIETVRVKTWKDNNLMGDYRGCIIADLTESHGLRKHAFAEAEANAKIIASAPDMLEALKEALDQLESWNQESEDTFTMKRIKEVIKKATE